MKSEKVPISARILRNAPVGPKIRLWIILIIVKDKKNYNEKPDCFSMHFHLTISTVGNVIRK